MHPMPPSSRQHTVIARFPSSRQRSPGRTRRIRVGRATRQIVPAMPPPVVSETLSSFPFRQTGKPGTGGDACQRASLLAFDSKMKRIGIILIVAIVLGSGYGCLSALMNQNPYDYTVTKDAWHWQPSPVWFPSYILCKVPRNGFGITHTRSGYLFRSEVNRKAYFIASTILGGILGGVVAGLVLAVTRKRRDSVEQENA